MTESKDEPRIEARVVVVIDICSSTAIMEDLLANNHEKIWRDFLIALKNFLRNARHEPQFKFELYKFTGDGWILLFPHTDNFRNIMKFLDSFCKHFDQRFERMVKRYLDLEHKVIGVTIGIDRGKLIRFMMNEQIEYVGRPINLACRLQAAIVQADPSPQYKALMAAHLFASVGQTLGVIRKHNCKRKLRHVARDEQVRCTKLDLNPAVRAITPSPVRVGPALRLPARRLS